MKLVGDFRVGHGEATTTPAAPPTQEVLGLPDLAPLGGAEEYDEDYEEEDDDAANEREAMAELARQIGRVDRHPAQAVVVLYNDGDATVFSKRAEDVVVLDLSATAEGGDEIEYVLGDHLQDLNEALKSRFPHEQELP